ncbi:MAG: hypothetical protein AAF404_06315 [Pseudomonadota bacterium]
MSKPDSNKPNNDEKSYWLDQPGNIRLIVWALVAVCAALVVFDFFYKKYGHFDFEYWPAFYAWYGFLSYCAIVLSAKQLRKILSRDENYYEDEDPDTNNEIDAGQPYSNERADS